MAPKAPAPQPAPQPAPKQTTVEPTKPAPAPAQPVPRTTATLTRAGQYASEGEAKSRCSGGDIVVWAHPQVQHLSFRGTPKLREHESWRLYVRKGCNRGRHTCRKNRKASTEGPNRLKKASTSRKVRWQLQRRERPRSAFTCLPHKGTLDKERFLPLTARPLRVASGCS